jgi:hypothetical protein
MKKSFYIISAFATILGSSWFFLELFTLKAFSTNANPVETLTYLAIVGCMAIFPLASLIFHYIKDRQGNPSQKYLKIFIIINCVITLISFLFATKIALISFLIMNL